jgi:hypothetical protein
VTHQEQEQDDDEYQYDRLIAKAVKLGYGKASEVKDEPMVDILRFLYAAERKSAKQKMTEFLNG